MRFSSSYTLLGQGRAGWGGSWAQGSELLGGHWIYLKAGWGGPVKFSKKPRTVSSPIPTAHFSDLELPSNSTCLPKLYHSSSIQGGSAVIWKNVSAKPLHLE